MPNSAARLTLAGMGGASAILTSILGLIRLAPRGGRGLDKSGPDIEGFLCFGGDPLTDLPLSIGPLLLKSFDGLRILSPIADSEGLLIEA
jgi:hypothetical protein